MPLYLHLSKVHMILALVITMHLYVFDSLVYVIAER